MPKIPKISKPFPKALSLAMAGVLLSACQSAPSTHSTTPTPAHNITHIDKSLSPSKLAQHDLVTALRQHMNAERYAVSTYHYAVKPLAVSEIDKDSDSAFTTFIKVMDYKNKAHKTDDDTSEPYMTISDYLGDDGELGDLPYLRYDDEQHGLTPDTVTRVVGMSEEYQAVSDEIRMLAYELESHAFTSAYINMGDFVKDTGRFDQQAFKKYINDFDRSFQAKANALLATAQGYQKQDIRQLQACATTFKQGAINTAKHIKTADDITNHVDELYSLITSVNACTHAVTGETQALHPYHYISNQTTQQELQQQASAKECATHATTQNQALIQSGKDYIKHADEFNAVHEEYISCYEPLVESAMDDDDYYESHDPYSGVFGSLRAYREMKEQEREQGKTDVQSRDYGLSSLLGGIFKMNQTPEQVTAQNLYQYQHVSVQGLSHHEPSARRSQHLWSIDYDCPTATYSMQLPVRADHAKGELTADVSAVLPLVALISPKHAPLPKDVPDGLMSFALPDELQKQIPTDIIYTAITDGIIAGMDGLNGEKFTPMDISQDVFAKEVGASRAIKVEFGAKEMGKAYAIIAKHVGRDLHAYVDKQPEHCADKVVDHTDTDSNPISTPNTVKSIIDNFTILNSSYRTDDVGGLFGAVEGILPFALNTTSYVYLDRQGNIIATQTLSSLDEHISGMTTQSLNQVRYDKGLFDKHALARQFKDAFTKTTAVDGVALIKQAKKENDQQYEALMARYGYDYESSPSDDHECEGDTACAAAEAAIATEEAR